MYVICMCDSNVWVILFRVCTNDKEWTIFVCVREWMHVCNSQQILIVSYIYNLFFIKHHFPLNKIVDNKIIYYFRLIENISNEFKYSKIWRKIPGKYRQLLRFLFWFSKDNKIIWTIAYVKSNNFIRMIYVLNIYTYREWVKSS